MARQTTLRVPCCYQGGKQRVASQIVDKLLAVDPGNNETMRFYDLCCGSGAITIELINRGIEPRQITMLDISSWGAFWASIGDGQFDLDAFSEQLRAIPADKRKIKPYMVSLAEKPVDDNEAYLYPILQSCSFGGKQIWLKGNHWENAFFRDYWEPTENSIRKSPANPMQPSPTTLYNRVLSLVNSCQGITCLKTDIMPFAETVFSEHSIVYVDPPYQKTTSYGFAFDIRDFVETYKKRNSSPLFVSEGIPLNDDAEELAFGGAKGGISGNKSTKHREWLSRF